ncbi:ankyrin repeat-containing domain protein [Xylaria acuta]|nr:ankyrin repeat-containing domain protein [Xylaria acuta]
MTASNGYFQCAKALATHGVNTNLSDGQTLPLLSAVQAKRLEMVRLRLDHGANPNVATEKFKLPLLAPVDNEGILMVKLLVEKGADIEMEDQTETTMKTTPSSASSFLNKDMLDYLLLMGADVNHVAVGSADINAMVSEPVNWAPINAVYDNTATLRALIEGGTDINYSSGDGTVIFQAARWGYEATVELLLEYRNSLDLDKELIGEEDGENNGMSPLYITCRDSHVGIMRLLLEAGADAQHKTRYGQFPLRLCTEINLSRRDNDGNTALHKIDVSTPLVIVRLLAGNVEVCRYLFSRTASWSGMSGTSSGLLHRAVFSADLDAIKMAIEAGAGVNEIDPRTGETPLYTHLTIRSPSILVVRYLADTCKAAVNRVGGHFKYPIMQACKKSDLEIICFLVDTGADPEARDKLGRTAVHYTAAIGDEEDVEQILRSSKIGVNQKNNDGWTPLM